jgi:hypothetical protein
MPDDQWALKTMRFFSFSFSFSCVGNTKKQETNINFLIGTQASEFLLKAFRSRGTEMSPHVEALLLKKMADAIGCVKHAYDIYLPFPFSFSLFFFFEK